ncbi:hypothetical protein R0981_22635 [Escherichia albertii]|nr:hypothetical protein [Escherichia albertii]EJM1769079.1 hypothetical protein [Escherichia albertii]EJO0119456.1 hypothetical protein [Escherichia albertii]HBM9791634.1 hypothetical protein [Escherichia albertii]
MAIIPTTSPMAAPTGTGVISLYHRQRGIHDCISYHTSRTVRGVFLIISAIYGAAPPCQGYTQITADQSLYRCRCGLYRLLVFSSGTKN